MREEEKLTIRIIAQVDTAAHKIKHFIEKAARAGVNRVFIGLENINPDNLKEAHKGQNRITEYRAMLQAWHSVGTLTYAGYILGFPGDTPESIERDIRIIKKELPIDLLEFFLLTPLPGSADHKRMHLAGVPMAQDLNKYDLVHVTAPHETMSEETLREVYDKAWDLYYSPDHVEQIIRRTKAWGFNPKEMMLKLLTFYASWRLEGVHPLESGFLRRKYRRDRRPTFERESLFTFYPKYWWSVAKTYLDFFRMYREHSRIMKRALTTDSPYEDVAMTPVGEADIEALELYTQTAGAKAVVDKQKKIKISVATHKPVAAAAAPEHAEHH
jgi:radical SAM superfamily enzyme YgiQ (UPF0313 family)